MKHARKMILVDATTHGGGGAAASQNLNKNIGPLTNAIKSLANSTEFNRSHFGPSTTIVSRLHNELEEILERRDLDPTTKLKLYNQELKRFLFLYRHSDRESGFGPTPTPIPTPTPTPTTLPLSEPERQQRMSGVEFWRDTDSLPGSEMGAVGGYSRASVAFSPPSRREPRFSESPNSYMDVDPLRGEKRAQEREPEHRVGKKFKRTAPQSIQRDKPKSKYRSNLPRTTPKHEILRLNPTRKREGSFDYFEDWISKKRKK